MKNKVLYAQVIKVIEELAVVMRNYSEESLYLNLTIFTKDNTIICDGDPVGIPDFYSVRVHTSEDFNEDIYDPIINESARIYYSGNGKELIRNVFKFHGEGNDDDSQGRTQQ